MIKIYVNNKLIILTACLDENIRHKNNELICFFKDKKSLLQDFKRFIREDKIQKLTIFNKNLNKLYKSFKSCFNYIEAAGGLVVNSKKEILFIKKRNKWDLPKGKVDEYENYEQTAIREVQEECRIKAVKILKPLCSTYHIYFEQKNIYLKKTVWYLMEYKGKSIAKPQLQENITTVAWKKYDDLDLIRKNTYLSIIDVLEKLK